MSAARINGATPDVEPRIAVGEADEAVVVDIDVLLCGSGGRRPAWDETPTSRTAVRK
jgi:hypothetical protein